MIQHIKINGREIRPIGLCLKFVKAEIDGSAVATYEATFQDIGAGMVVKEQLQFSVNSDSTAVGMTITGCISPNTDDAFAKLADWLEAFAHVIRNRKAGVPSVPIYSSR